MGELYNVRGKPTVILYNCIINRHAGTPKLRHKHTSNLNITNNAVSYVKLGLGFCRVRVLEKISNTLITRTRLLYYSSLIGVHTQGFLSVCLPVFIFTIFVVVVVCLVSSGCTLVFGAFRRCVFNIIIPFTSHSVVGPIALLLVVPCVTQNRNRAGTKDPFLSQNKYITGTLYDSYSYSI